jgi:hypothetical protein
MALRLDTDLRNALATAFTNQFPAGSTIEIRTGTQPASANNAASGTLLATITLPSTPFGSASGGAISKNGTWSATISTSGTAGYARFIGGSNVCDVSVGTSGADMIIDNATLVSGGTVTVSAFTYTQPSGE